MPGMPGMPPMPAAQVEARLARPLTTQTDTIQHLFKGNLQDLKPRCRQANVRILLMMHAQHPQDPAGWQPGATPQ